jgi:hypothetical protein
MIITKLKGGLGNQLFQYAIGRQLAFNLNSELKIDVSFFLNTKDATPRDYKLYFYNINVHFATNKDITKVLGSVFFRSFKRRCWKMGFDFFHWNYVREDVFGFYPEILELKGDVMLEGYWQSERYFNSIRSILLDEIRLVNQFETTKFSTFASEIQNCESVAIHIRRGDYVNHPTVNAQFGVINMEYYSNAIVEIAKRLKTPIFYIFSDDIDWCKNNLPTTDAHHFVSGFADYEELMLMSSCQHQIIANSSFSWWGAWLNINPNKIVIAPKQWFASPDLDTSNVVPESWIRL